ncbi:MAG: hypothetical protein KC419_22080 [Anaerolineales bacterium]|nr:hypothetical protein [Anaerolineales bacterium]MCA9931197.1 hypothetical protein [Anaerolineales bacterium]
MMAKAEWIQLGVKYCNRVNEEVELMEKRVYPINVLNSSGEQYRVLARRCSAGYQCGHMEEPCVWVEEGADGRQYNR